MTNHNTIFNSIIIKHSNWSKVFVFLFIKNLTSWSTRALHLTSDSDFKFLKKKYFVFLEIFKFNNNFLTLCNQICSKRLITPKWMWQTPATLQVLKFLPRFSIFDNEEKRKKFFSKKSSRKMVFKWF
jgi:hypothetical protein